MSSSPERELFENIADILNIKEESYYANNQFFRYFKELKRTFAYDFVNGKKIIEFNGDYWHCNPKYYPKNYYHAYLGKTAEQIWTDNEIKINAIKNYGYDVLVIWESDYNKNKEQTVQKCLDFLNT